jgi:transcriptional regulator with XRE-family HTH domain
MRLGMTKERDRGLNIEEPLRENTPGRRVAALRNSRGLTQSALARKLGCAITTLRAWEEDNALPKDDYMGKLTTFFAVTERAIRFGDQIGSTDVQEPDYPAWHRFKQTALYAALDPDALDQIKSYRWPDGREPRDSAYVQLASGLLDAVPEGEQQH